MVTKTPPKFKAPTERVGSVIRGDPGSKVETSAPAFKRARGGGGSFREQVKRGAATEKAAAEKAATLEAQAKAKADKEAAEMERQIDIKSRTIGGQVSTVEPPTFGTPTIDDKSFFKRRGDVPIFVPTFGSASADPVTGEFIGGPRETTPIKELRRQEEERGVPLELVGKSTGIQQAVTVSNIEADIQSTFQERIDTGELDVESAEKLASEQFETRTSKEFEKFRGGGEDLFDLQKDIRSEALIDIGRSIGSANPLGATILGAEALQRNQEIIVSSVPGEATIQEIRQRSPEAALFFGAGAVGAVGGVFKAAGAVDDATLAALRQKTPKFVGKEFTAGGDEALVQLTGRRSVQGADELIEANLPVFKTGADTFSVTGGRGTSTLEFKPFLKTLQGFGDEGVIVTRQNVGLFGRGRTAETVQRFGDDLIDLEKIKTTKGDFGITKGGPVIDDIKFKPGSIDFDIGFTPETLELGSFGGVSRTKDAFTFFRGGKISKLRFRSGRSSAVVDLGQEGVIQKVKVPELDLLGLGDDGALSVGKVIKGSGGKTPFSKTFGTSEVTVQASDLGVGAAELGQTALPRITPKIDTAGGVIGFKPPTGNNVFSIKEEVSGPKASLRNGLDINFDVRQAPSLNIGLVTKTSPRQKGARKSELDTFQTPISASALDQGLALRQKPKLKLKQRAVSELDPFAFGFGFGGGGFGGGGFGTPAPVSLPSISFELASRRRKTKPKKKTTRIAPSLTGITQFDIGGITGPLPEEFGSLGILPGQVRRVSKKKKVKKKMKGGKN